MSAILCRKPCPDKTQAPTQWDVSKIYKSKYKFVLHKLVKEEIILKLKIIALVIRMKRVIASHARHIAQEGALPLKRPGRSDQLHSTVARPSTCTSAFVASFFEVAMAVDWKRVLSDIPLEKPKTAYFVSPPFSTGGHTSR